MSPLKTPLLTLLLLALILAVADLFVITTSVLLLIFAGIVFGVFIHGVSDWPGRRTGLSYRAGYWIAVSLLFLLLIVGFYYLGSQVALRAEELWLQLESSVQQASKQLKEQPWAKRYLPNASELQSTLTGSSSMLPGMFKGLTAVGWALTGPLVILFVGLYASYDPELYRTGLVKLFPKDRRPVVREVLQKLRTALGRWIIGRMASMTVVGVLTAVGLWFLDVPLPITLGVLAALLTFIPNIGPLLAAVPQVLLALNVGTTTALYVLLFNIVLQGIESYLITPIIQRHEVTLPPIMTISAQLLMGVMFGVIGIMMAAPLMVVILVLVQGLYIQRWLGDENPGRLTSEI